MRDGAVAQCLVLLLSTLVVRVRDEPPCSSLLMFEGAERRTSSEGVAGDLEEGRTGRTWQRASSRRAGAGSRARETTRARCLSCFCSLLSSYVSATSLRAHRCRGARARGEGRAPTARRASGRGQERVAEHEGRRRHAVSHASALRPCPVSARRAPGLIAVELRGCGEGWGGGCGRNERRASRRWAAEHTRRCGRTVSRVSAPARAR